MAVYSVFQPIIIAMLYKFSLHLFLFCFFEQNTLSFLRSAWITEMVLANLEQMVRKEKGMMNGMV